jgi:hypothetical protein
MVVSLPLLPGCPAAYHLGHASIDQHKRSICAYEYLQTKICNMVTSVNYYQRPVRVSLH